MNPNQPAAPVVPFHCYQPAPTSFNEVRDEFVLEDTEEKVYATGVFENCPDANLSEDYFESLKRFVLSESHLQDNIDGVKIVQLSSRQLGPQLYVHLVNAELVVKTEMLWEPPSIHIWIQEASGKQ